MSIQRSADGTSVTFVLGDEDPAAPVSVVGSFNDWTPGADPFEAAPDGSRSVTVVVPAGTDVHFRYLGPDGFWFDDPDADEVTAGGSVLWASSRPEQPVGDADQPDGDADQPDETGERLEKVSERIDAAKSAAHDLVDRNILDPEAVPDREDEGSTTGEVAE